jgi:beta-lactamase superfamily II metal-dependent hydrolase
MAQRFAGYPSAVVFAQTDGKKGTKPVQHLLWGDWLSTKPERSGHFIKVRARGVDGWMHEESIQTERLLEVIFVDIGQGDGCLIVTPEDKHLVVDAGIGDNMARFLNWRYGDFDRPFVFEAGIISHPDEDHYGGFDKLFDIKNLTFQTLYHNGIVERQGENPLGKKTTSGSPRYLTELVINKAQLVDLLSTAFLVKGKQYPALLKKGLDHGKFDACTMLSKEIRFLPGYEEDKPLCIQVLGPVIERDQGGKPRLRWLGSVAETKNGHSVVLRLQYKNISMLLGGDLNIPAEELLLKTFTGLPVPPKTIDDHTALIEASQKVFQVDIAKSCHHGSADFSSIFLQALNPIVTVISSGDDEPHSHPRADTLGSIGLYSRGPRPLIFSTELARSTKEAIKHPAILRQQLQDLQTQIDTASETTDSERREKARLLVKFNKLVGAINRSIAVFGAINVRTDGARVVIAQKIERPTSKARKWDIYQLESEGNGPLRYLSKH